jgi:hypothetical protein
MKEKLEKEMLVSLTIDSRELHWVKKGKEILIDGRMFDIKTFHFDGKAYKINGLFDDDETALDKKLEEQQRKNDPSGKLIINLLQWFQSVFFNDQQENDLVIQKQIVFVVSDKWILASPFQSVPTPPPNGLICFNENIHNLKL